MEEVRADALVVRAGADSRDELSNEGLVRAVSVAQQRARGPLGRLAPPVRQLPDAAQEARHAVVRLEAQRGELEVLGIDGRTVSVSRRIGWDASGLVGGILRGGVAPSVVVAPIVVVVAPIVVVVAPPVVVAPGGLHRLHRRGGGGGLEFPRRRRAPRVPVLRHPIAQLPEPLVLFPFALPPRRGRRQYRVHERIANRGLVVDPERRAPRRGSASPRVIFLVVVVREPESSRDASLRVSGFSRGDDSRDAQRRSLRASARAGTPGSVRVPEAGDERLGRGVRARSVAAPLHRRRMRLG